jgi:hypothetical protein
MDFGRGFDSRRLHQLATDLTRTQLSEQSAARIYQLEAGNRSLCAYHEGSAGARSVPVDRRRPLAGYRTQWRYCDFAIGEEINKNKQAVAKIGSSPAARNAGP